MEIFDSNKSLCEELFGGEMDVTEKAPDFLQGENSQVKQYWECMRAPAFSINIVASITSWTYLMPGVVLLEVKREIGWVKETITGVNRKTNAWSACASIACCVPLPKSCSPLKAIFSDWILPTFELPFRLREAVHDAT